MRACERNYIMRQLAVELRDVEEERARIDGGRQADGRVQIEIAADGSRDALLFVEDERIFLQRTDLGNVVVTFFVIT